MKKGFKFKVFIFIVAFLGLMAMLHAFYQRMDAHYNTMATEAENVELLRRDLAITNRNLETLRVYLEERLDARITFMAEVGDVE
jgi:hypothetical protein